MADVRLLALQKGGTVCRYSFDRREIGERVPPYPPRTDALHPDHLYAEDSNGFVSHDVRQAIFHRTILSNAGGGALQLRRNAARHWLTQRPVPRLSSRVLPRPRVPPQRVCFSLLQLALASTYFNNSLANAPAALSMPLPSTPGEGAPWFATSPICPIASGTVMPPASVPAAAYACAAALSASLL